MAAIPTKNDYPRPHRQASASGGDAGLQGHEKRLQIDQNRKDTRSQGRQHVSGDSHQRARIRR